MHGLIFISYSRQESPFADSLIDNLEDRGFNVWVDYQDLTPAKPWLDEINRGIEAADIVLLVVSRTSMDSRFVSEEMQMALALKKRIILAIFEATKLPPELEHCEWVDFRGSFKRGLNDLINGVKKKKPLPQKGFKTPSSIWLCFLVSVIVSLIALPTFWTLYIPYYLIPLPYRILKRDFDFFHVQLAIVLLPFALFMSEAVFYEHKSSETAASEEGLLITAFFMLSFILAPLLFFLLRSKGMRRWGKPIATRPGFANLYHPDIKEVRSVSFAVDAAPEDKRYTNDIIKAMQEHGHRFVENAREAEITFVLISRYKSVIDYNPETQIVYPVLLQAVKDLDPKLQRIQWIDFRRGLKNLSVLARLLPEPAIIFKSLGIPPTGNQTVFPSVIQAITAYLITLGIVILGSWIIVLFKWRYVFSLADIVIQVIVLVISLATTFFTNHALINRKGRLASLHYLVSAIIVLGFFVLILFFHLGSIGIQAETARGGSGSTIIIFLIVPLIYIFGLMLITPLALWKWKDLWRWFPRRARKKQAVHQD